MTEYHTILADPPWQLALTGVRTRRKGAAGPQSLPYPTMPLQDILALDVGAKAAVGAHLWLWTTNQHLEAGFRVMAAWGFKYLAPIHWMKPSGTGNWFVHRTQTLLFGYRRTCRFPLQRYRPNIITTSDPVRHSQKPDASYAYIESISPGPRLELFARQHRIGWDVWGNEVVSNVSFKSSPSGTARAELSATAEAGHFSHNQGTKP